MIKPLPYLIKYSARIIGDVWFITLEKNKIDIYEIENNLIEFEIYLDFKWKFVIIWNNNNKINISSILRDKEIIICGKDQYLPDVKIPSKPYHKIR